MYESVNSARDFFGASARNMTTIRDDHDRETRRCAFQIRTSFRYTIMVN